MATWFFDGVRCVTTSTLTGPVTFAGAVSGYLTEVLAGCPDQAVISYALIDNVTLNFESAWGIYTASTRTVTRNTRTSSNSNNPISLSGSAQIYITPTAADLNIFNELLHANFGGI